VFGFSSRNGSGQHNGFFGSAGSILQKAFDDALEKWEFKPALRSGKTVDAWLELPLRITLAP